MSRRSDPSGIVISVAPASDRALFRFAIAPVTKHPLETHGAHQRRSPSHPFLRGRRSTRTEPRTNPSRYCIQRRPVAPTGSVLSPSHGLRRFAAFDRRRVQPKPLSRLMPLAGSADERSLPAMGSPIAVGGGMTFRLSSVTHEYSKADH